MRALAEGIGPAFAARLAIERGFQLAAMAVLGRLSEAYGHRNVLAAATRLSRTFATLVETLRRLRNGGSQIIRIERVEVRDGGQAVIGNVKQEGRHE